MSNQEEKFVRYWKKRSEGGKNRYVLFTVVFAIVIGVLSKLAFLFFPDHESLTLVSVLFRILVMCIVGFFFGRWQWSNNEKRYQELINRTPDGD
jgi:hypothetical protein